MQTTIVFPNGDFEAGEAGWTIARDRGDCGITTARVAGGKQALRIVADAARKGAKIEGPMVPCRGPGLVELHGKVCALSGRLLGLWIREYDAAGQLLPCSQANWGEIGGTDGQWHDLLRQVVLNEQTAALQLFFLAYPKPDERIEVYVDELSFVRVPLRIPPWPSQYKLRPDDTARLTAADVVGPDGIVYPNWQQVGVQGDIPHVPVAVRLADAGARPGTDISDVLDRACREVGAKGGGAVLIGNGTYYLDRPVTVRHSGIVIRGAGRVQTRLVFRYAVGTPGTDGRPADAQAEKAGTSTRAALYFHGAGLEATEHLLAEDGKRGDTELVFRDVGDLRKGDKINLHAPLTDAFCDRIRNRAPRGWNRVGYFEIRAIDGPRVRINQPLRVDFPAADGTYARRLTPVERCGVEDLTIEHESRLPISAIEFNWGWNGWVLNVKVLKAGCNGVHAEHSKWIEVRDCELDDTWNHDGGQAYAGFTRSADCLMEDCMVRKYRHAPVVQFGAMGCVFRNSRFEGSDLQWHAGWSTENLFENCVVTSAKGTGSYGYGAYATGSDDNTHGPNGPRNVVYGCDFTSELDGAMLNGVSEHWLFLHNRFVVGKGAGLVASGGSFDHLIRGNTFVLQDGTSPMVRLATPDCVGIDLIDNAMHGGNAKIIEGAAVAALNTGNQALPATKPGEPLPARPKANPPSIYAWQNRNPLPDFPPDGRAQ